MGFLDKLLGPRGKSPNTEPASLRLLTDDAAAAESWDAMLDESIVVSAKSTDSELAEHLRRIGGRDVSGFDLEREIATALGESTVERFANTLTKLGLQSRVELVSSLKGAKPAAVYRKIEPPLRP